MNNLSIPTVFKYTYGVNWGSWGGGKVAGQGADGVNIVGDMGEKKLSLMRIEVASSWSSMRDPNHCALECSKYYAVKRHMNVERQNVFKNSNTNSSAF